LLACGGPSTMLACRNNRSRRTPTTARTATRQPPACARIAARSVAATASRS
jgi:hypothetical protein